VTGSFGAARTTTEKVQLAERARASLVLQVTVVVPTGKADPLIGEQLVVKGAWPAVTVGDANEKACPVILFLAISSWTFYWCASFVALSPTTFNTLTL